MVIEPRRSETRVPTPDTNHYYVSEETKQKFQILAGALRAAATLCDAFDEGVSKIVSRQTGAIFHALGEHVITLIDEARFSEIIRESTKIGGSR